MVRVWLWGVVMVRVWLWLFVEDSVGLGWTGKGVDFCARVWENCLRLTVISFGGIFGGELGVGTEK